MYLMVCVLVLIIIKGKPHNIIIFLMFQSQRERERATVLNIKKYNICIKNEKKTFKNGMIQQMFK